MRSHKPRQQALGPKSDIPDRLYFKIGEVALLVGVQTHVLRYWEKEIPLVRPAKSRSNQRRYRRRDVEIFRDIQRLLHEERYTLAGARRRLLAGNRSEPSEAAPQPPASKEAPPTSPRAPQMDLGFAAPAAAGLERLRSGLRDLIRLAGEEP